VSDAYFQRSILIFNLLTFSPRIYFLICNGYLGKLVGNCKEVAIDEVVKLKSLLPFENWDTTSISNNLKYTVLYISERSIDLNFTENFRQ